VRASSTLTCPSNAGSSGSMMKTLNGVFSLKMESRINEIGYLGKIHICVIIIIITGRGKTEKKKY
jgi:hypothetical protein